MDPILGKNIFIQFFKGGDYFDYVCATDVRIDFTKETKPVKTLGDGNWTKDRAQKNSAQIQLDGLFQVDDDSVPHAFDVLAYFMNDVDINFRMLYADENDAVVKVMEGVALPINVSMGGGSEGFGTASATLKVNGRLDIRDTVEPCDTGITNLTFTQEAPGSPVQVFVTQTGTSVGRWEYSINGGSRVPKFTNPFFIALGTGLKNFKVWPVCDSGFDGTPRDEDYTVV